MLTHDAKDDLPLVASMSLSPNGGAAVISVTGEIDMSNAAQLQQYIDAVVDLGQLDVVIDATDLRFMDSTGLSVIIVGLKALHEQGGTLSFLNPQPIVKKLLDVTGIAAVLD